MPQLEIATYPSQIFWLVVSFVTLYLIMSRIIIPRISSVIKNREDEIKNNIYASEKIYKETKIINDELDKVRENTETEAREIINSLKETTNKKISQNYNVLKEKLEKKLQKNEQEILKNKKKVLKEINAISLNLSDEILKKILIKNKKKNKIKLIINKNLKEIKNDINQ